MTLESLQESRRFVLDRQELEGAGHPDSDGGYLYNDCYLISLPPFNPNVRGRWHLVLGNCEYWSNSLEDLESILFNFLNA